MVKNWLTIIKKIIGTAILIAAIVFMVKVIIDGKYIPFLANFGQFLLDKFLEILDSLKSWLVK
jgi:hypothetical protein